MDDDRQSAEELDAHYGPKGPVAAANAWMKKVLAGDSRSAWKRTDPTFRLVLAQSWLWANREHTDVGVA